ncbi:component of TRAPP complex [Strigomonas culicis]|uniref:Component of TRAPP complex n=1 Tax=Strigomonas culicis TaxID=28005 RepID=S9USH5_9TRYP|nr:component of TRAPP complex [Strigomonas culicis]|eukprot:EPY33907.1 component of TRAPP complex [Strigomonas culicis]
MLLFFPFPFLLYNYYYFSCMLLASSRTLCVRSCIRRSPTTAGSRTAHRRREGGAAVVAAHNPTNRGREVGDADGLPDAGLVHDVEGVLDRVLDVGRVELAAQLVHLHRRVVRHQHELDERGGLIDMDVVLLALDEVHAAAVHRVHVRRDLERHAVCGEEDAGEGELQVRLCAELAEEGGLREAEARNQLPGLIDDPQQMHDHRDSGRGTLQAHKGCY